MESLAGIVIGAVGTAAGVVSAWLAVRATTRARESESKVRQIEATTVETSKTYEAEVLKRYGFKAGSISDIRHVRDLQGTVELVRQYKDVKVTETAISLGYLPGRVWVRPGEILESPELIPPPAGFPKAVWLTEHERARQRIEFHVEVQGGLTSGDPALAYGFRVTYARGVVMTREDMIAEYQKDAFQSEYVSFDVDFPVDELELGVEFPRGFVVPCYPAVFLGYSECLHETELRRTRDGLQRTPAGGAVLRVSNPLLGFRYAIYWTPPPKEQVDSLQRAGNNSYRNGEETGMRKTGGG